MRQTDINNSYSIIRHEYNMITNKVIVVEFLK